LNLLYLLRTSRSIPTGIDAGSALLSLYKLDSAEGRSAMHDRRIETRGVEPEIETPDGEVEFREDQDRSESEDPPRKPQTGRLPARAAQMNKMGWW